MIKIDGLTQRFPVSSGTNAAFLEIQPSCHSPEWMVGCRGETDAHQPRTRGFRYFLCLRVFAVFMFVMYLQRTGDNQLAFRSKKLLVFLVSSSKWVAYFHYLFIWHERESVLFPGEIRWKQIKSIPWVSFWFSSASLIVGMQLQTKIVMIAKSHLPLLWWLCRIYYAPLPNDQRKIG